MRVSMETVSAEVMFMVRMRSVVVNAVASEEVKRVTE
jgi:hypothetical protein